MCLECWFMRVISRWIFSISEVLFLFSRWLRIALHIFISWDHLVSVTILLYSTYCIAFYTYSLLHVKQILVLALYMLVHVLQISVKNCGKDILILLKLEIRFAKSNMKKKCVKVPKYCIIRKVHVSLTHNSINVCGITFKNKTNIFAPLYEFSLCDIWRQTVNWS